MLSVLVLQSIVCTVIRGVWYGWAVFGSCTLLSSTDVHLSSSVNNLLVLTHGFHPGHRLHSRLHVHFVLTVLARW